MMINPMTLQRAAVLAVLQRAEQPQRVAQGRHRFPAP
jgi:hypothetical protein